VRGCPRSGTRPDLHCENDALPPHWEPDSRGWAPALAEILKCATPMKCWG
jgi:hypothetical protein